MEETSPDRPLLLFDGVCNLCNGAVRFILKHDAGKRFLFASLQSPSGQAWLERLRRGEPALETVLLIENGACHAKSTAALRTLRLLGWPWKLGYALIVIPRPLRDAVYDLIARNRYRIFGRRDECMLPPADLKARFLP